MKFPESIDEAKQLAINLFDHIKGEEVPNIYGAASYFPFIGWLFVYIFRKGQNFCVFHAFQALKINLISAILFFIVWFITNFPPIRWFLRLIMFDPIATDFIEYITWVFLLVYSAWGAAIAYKGDEVYLPYMDFIENKMDKSKGVSEE